MLVTTETPGGERREYVTRNVVLGLGAVPNMACVDAPSGATRVFHSGEFLNRIGREFPDPNAAFHAVVVGAGQSAAEIVDYLLSRYENSQVTALMRLFSGWSPSKTSVEKMVLGLGKHTGEWFREAPPPADDGEVLVVQVDSKATPTATEAELQKRRGKRRPNPFPDSPRHRGREARRRRGPKPRRKKGDKSKNYGAHQK